MKIMRGEVQKLIIGHLTISDWWTEVKRKTQPLDHISGANSLFFSAVETPSVSTTYFFALQIVSICFDQKVKSENKGLMKGDSGDNH